MDSPKIRLFDAHCHLQDHRISHALKEVIQTALGQGVERFACNGCCEQDWPKVQELAQEYQQVTPNFGLHPWWVPERSSSWLDNLRKKLLEVPSAGLGECGLDQSSRCPRSGFKEQCEAFEAQLHLAQELRRPASVHCVKAFPELQRSLQQHNSFDAGLVLHSWMGPQHLVAPLARIPGVYFSLSGHSLRSDKKAAAMVKQIPLDRLLLETDAPDGLPRQHPEQQQPVPGADEHQDARLNHPANIRIVLDVVAQMRDQPAAEVANATFDNTCQLFSKL